ncbi:Zc3h12a-like ribonuclease NYN domain-containing protein [Pelagophyceae sp. CCMP2097]|nr:Zc3h12a-like ribonuclease NYN domain-containing protein [Pelagophyceae sp. CCMP2097]
MGAGSSVAAVYRDASSPLPSVNDTAQLLRLRAMDDAPRVHVVIDGMNVALANVPAYERCADARRSAGLRGLQLAIEYFATAGVSFKIFAPRGFVDDHAELEALLRAGVLFATPGGLDDNFMIAHADNHGSFVVSNDRFLDHARDRGYDQRWLDWHRVAFMFDPSFAPDPDALERMRAAHDGNVPAFAAPRRARLRPPRQNDAAANSAAAPPRRPPASSEAADPPSPASEQQRRYSIIGHGTASGHGMASVVGEDAAALPMSDAPLADAAPAVETRVETRVVRVPLDAVGRIIGKRGANVQRVERETGCKVDVAKSPAYGGDGETDVTVRGPPASVSAALEAIRAAVVAAQRYPADARRRAASLSNSDTSEAMDVS